MTLRRRTHQFERNRSPPLRSAERRHDRMDVAMRCWSPNRQAMGTPDLADCCKASFRYVAGSLTCCIRWYVFAAALAEDINSFLGRSDDKNHADAPVHFIADSKN